MTKQEWIIYDSKLTQYLGIDGLVLYPFVLISNKEDEAKPSLLKHELTHVHQVKREGFCKFYSKYLFYIVTNVWKNKNLIEILLEIKTALKQISNGNKELIHLSS